MYALVLSERGRVEVGGGFPSKIQSTEVSHIKSEDLKAASAFPTTESRFSALSGRESSELSETTSAELSGIRSTEFSRIRSPELFENRSAEFSRTRSNELFEAKSTELAGTEPFEHSEVDSTELPKTRQVELLGAKDSRLHKMEDSTEQIDELPQTETNGLSQTSLELTGIAELPHVRISELSNKEIKVHENIETTAVAPTHSRFPGLPNPQRQIRLEETEQLEAANHTTEPFEAAYHADELVETVSHTTEPVEAAYHADELVEAVSHTTEPVEAAYHTTEPVETAYHTNELVEAANHSTKPVEAAYHTTESVETAYHTNELVEAANHSTKPVEAAYHADELLEDANHTSEPVEAANHTNELDDTANHTTELIKTAYHTNDLVEAANHVDELVEAANHNTEPVEAANHTNEFVDTANRATEPLEAAEVTIFHEETSSANDGTDALKVEAAHHIEDEVESDVHKGESVERMSPEEETANEQDENMTTDEGDMSSIVDRLEADSKMLKTESQPEDSLADSTELSSTSFTLSNPAGVLDISTRNQTSGVQSNPVHSLQENRSSLLTITSNHSTDSSSRRAFSCAGYPRVDYSKFHYALLSYVGSFLDDRLVHP
jgi:hypothetical protein